MKGVLPRGSKAHYLSQFYQKEKKQLVVVTQDDVEAEGLWGDLEEV